MGVAAHGTLLGARGVTVIYSSGDGGVGDGNPDPATQLCQTNDGRNVSPNESGERAEQRTVPDSDMGRIRESF